MTTIAEMLQKARAVVRRRGASADDADDIVQEAFLRVEAYTRSQEARSQEALLVRTAVNISIDRARRQARSPFDVATADPDTVLDGRPAPDEHVRAQERLRRAQAGLDRLSPKARGILLAQRLEGMSYAEIAAREGMSVSAVEKQVARAVMFLVKWMDGW